MSIFYDTFWSFEETLDFLGLSLSRNYDACYEINEEDVTPTGFYYVWMGQHLLACGEIINRKYSQKSLLKKIKRIQEEAERHDIPYCFIERYEECFVCESNKTVEEVVFCNDHTEFERISIVYDKSITKAKWEDFVDAFHEIIREHAEDLGSECVDRLLKIKFKKKDIVITHLSIALSEKKENEVFKALLGEYKGEYLYRYMSAASFYRILNDQKISMCSLNGMNDCTEINYADDYCNIPPFINIYPYPFYFGDEVKLANHDYISSCVSQELADDLTMWRLYGDNGKGVCLRFKVDRIHNDFFLAPVSYARYPEIHPELDFIVDLSTLNIKGSKFGLYRLCVWKHFFKPYDYRTEKEIRLYKPHYDDESMKWISTQDGIYCPIIEFPITRDDYQYPLLFDAIILGPNFPQKRINKEQIMYRLSKSNIKIDYWKKNIVENSLISCYR